MPWRFATVSASASASLILPKGAAMPRRIRLMIADDHELVREGLRTLLIEEPTVELVGDAADGREAVAMATLHRPEVALLDIIMPHLDGIEATRQIRAAVATCQVLVLTSFAEDAQVREALQAGAIGYLLKDIRKAELVRAIRDAAEGRPTLHPEAQRHLIRQVVSPEPTSPWLDLTPREQEVLRLIASGRSNKEIGAALNLTEGTVKGYVSAVLVKLGVSDRTQAALYAVKHGLT